MKTRTARLTLGKLINALYEESAKLTLNRKLQTKLVYLTLMDMQKTRSMQSVRN